MRVAATMVGSGLVLLAACARQPDPGPVARRPAGDVPTPAAEATAPSAPRAADLLLPRRGTMTVVGRSAGPTFQVELAIDEAERTRGLMFRRRLADDAGMLFFMGRDHDWQFWMRNTYIPLDMLFLDAELRVVGVVANVPPLTEAMRSCGKQSRYVLELGAHQAERHGLRPGVQFRLERSAK